MAPMRAVMLADALQRGLWLAERGRFGGYSLSAYSLSVEVDRADFFVSHVHGESDRASVRKMHSLCEFLVLQPMLGRTFIVMPLLFLRPL